MSGFCCALNKNAPHADATVVKNMMEAVVYPGIGEVKTVACGPVAVAAYDQFGADADRFIYQDDRILVVCDAELYNYNELLNGTGDLEQFSEAKCIAGLYRQHGRHWWRNVQGVYAGVIWDKQQNKGIAFTDRIGVKPVVYYADKNHVVIASRIRSLTRLPSFDAQLDNQAIFSYLFMEMIPTPFTIFKKVRKLESGHSLSLDSRGVDVHRDWDMQYPDPKLTDRDEMADRIYNLTRDAVKKQIDYRGSVQNVGCFLSGGTDSSTIAGLINDLYSGESRTISIGFDEPGYDEMHYARIAAKAFHTHHLEYYVTPNDIFEQLPRIVAEYDEPFGNSSVIPAYYCAKLAKENSIDVLLGGDGGDELFGGNQRYHSHFADFKKYPLWLLNTIWPVLNAVPESMRFSLLRKAYSHVKRAKAPLHERIYSYSLFHYIGTDKIFEPDFLAAQEYVLPPEICRKYIERVKTESQLDRYLYNDLKLTLMDNDLRKVNMMTRLAHVNVRYPFLDYKLVEFTGLIPPELKVNNGELRILFKQTFSRILPQEILQKSKHGFGLPVVPWMLRPGPLHDLLEEVLNDRKTRERGIFRKEFLSRLFDNSRKDKTTFYGTYLYFILFFEMWLRQHIDKTN